MGRRILFGSCLASLGFVIAIVISELAVRLLVPQPPSWLAIYREHPTLPFYVLQPEIDQLCSTGETHFRVITDARGFRVGEKRNLSSNPSQVLWLGDSYAFGQGVNFEESFVGRLAVASPSNLEHLDSAVGGHGPVQYRLLLEHFLETGMKVDRVVAVTYVGNDFHDTVWSKDATVVKGIIGDRGDMRSLIKKHSHLYRLASAIWHRVGPGEDRFTATLTELATPDAWGQGILAEARPKYSNSLMAISKICKERGIPLHLVVLPTRAAVEFQKAGTPLSTDGYDPRLPVQEAVAIAKELGLDTFDALALLAAQPTDEIFFTFDGHLTPKGSKVLADALETHWPVLIGR